MKTLLVLAALLLSALPAAADDAWLNAQPKLYKLPDKAAVDRTLAEVQRRYPTFVQRLRAVSLLRVGTPYVLGCLGEEKAPDREPVFRIDQVDCTVFVLTNSAMAHGGSLAAARRLMTGLNYYAAADPVRYANRVHFTEDRLVNNRYFKDVTRQVAPAGSLKSTTLVLNRKQTGGRLLDIPWEKKMTVRYVPSASVTSAMLRRLPPAAGVAFVRHKTVPVGVFINHEGMVLDNRWLVHADSVSKRVAKTDLVEYVKKNADWFDGVLFYEFL